MEVYVQVERYQDGAPAYVDNISVISGKNAPTSPGIPAPEPEPAEPPAEKPDIIVNGAFSDGSSGWDLSGGAEIAEGVARLASGSNTDRMTQTVQLEKGKTYTLSADIVSCGARLQFGVSDYNGRYTQLEKVADADGIVQLTFTTAAHIDTVKIYFQVLRYQQSSNPVLIRNVSLVEGEMGNIPEPAPEPEPAPPADASLLSNGDFSNGADHWRLSGSAAIESGAAVLASGSNTDRMTQTVRLQRGKTYTLIVDVAECGAELQFGVNDYNGRYTKAEQTVSEAGEYTLTFTMAQHMDNVEVYLQVLRYQGSDEPVVINAVRLTEST